MTTREQHWRERIKEYEAGGVTVREFCAAHEVSAASFYVSFRQACVTKSGRYS